MGTPFSASGSPAPDAPRSRAAELRGPDLLRVTLAGQAVDGQLVIEPDGSLAVAMAVPADPRIPLLDSSTIRLRSATVGDDALVLTGSIDVAALLRR